jgi:hypothetical protein
LFVDFFNDNNVLDLKKIDPIHEIAFGKKLKDAITKLIAFNIITEENSVLSLTKEGHRVVKLGSWTAYLKKLDKYEKTERILPRVNIVATFVIGILGLIYSIRQYNLNENKDKIELQKSQKLDSLEKQVSALQLKLQDLEKKSTIHKHSDTVSKTK